MNKLTSISHFPALKVIIGEIDILLGLISYLVTGILLNRIALMRNEVWEASL